MKTSLKTLKLVTLLLTLEISKQTTRNAFKMLIHPNVKELYKQIDYNLMKLSFSSITKTIKYKTGSNEAVSIDFFFSKSSKLL